MERKTTVCIPTSGMWLRSDEIVLRALSELCPEPKRLTIDQVRLFLGPEKMSTYTVFQSMKRLTQMKCISKTNPSGRGTPIITVLQPIL